MKHEPVRHTTAVGNTLLTCPCGFRVERTTTAKAAQEFEAHLRRRREVWIRETVKR